MDVSSVHHLAVAYYLVEERFQPIASGPLQGFAGGGDRKDPRQDDAALPHGGEGVPIDGRGAREDEDRAQDAEKEARAADHGGAGGERRPAGVADMCAGDQPPPHPAAPSSPSLTRLLRPG